MLTAILTGHAREVLRAVALGPQVTTEVNGFTAEVARKKGVLLVRDADDGKGGKVKVPASDDHYYEVKVRPTGEHSEYPAADRPAVFKFTVAESPTASGFMGSTVYIPSGARFIGFTLAEKLHRPDRHTMGQRMPTHYGVDLSARYIDTDGKVRTLSVGGWVRKTTRESVEWQMAARSPVFYG